MPHAKPTTLPQKTYFDVKLETMLPAILTYRILAETPEEAVQLMKNAQPINIKHRLLGKRDIKVTVFDMGTTLIKFMQNIIR